MVIRDEVPVRAAARFRHGQTCDNTVMEESSVRVYGPVTDGQTRCVHYHSDKDVVALKFRCCGRYFPCFQCHADIESHAPERWPQSDWDTKAVLCGVCRKEMTINTYRATSDCPACGADFNPGCADHAHLYFDVSPEDGR
jgi:uncharacterized CHY-type Zn-finger protein